MIKTGFITGTGFYTLPNIRNVKERTVSTPFGDVSVDVGEIGEQQVAFIARHGKKHNIAPAQINYRANMFALHTLGVNRILATSVSGSLVKDWPPGTLILVDQFLDFTYGRRADTFYPMDGKLAHVDVTEPYSPELHDYLMRVAEQQNVTLKRGATYACFNGPRFETAAEIKMVRQLGGHLVGQTNYPEALLARELAIAYATVGVVSNYAAGMEGAEMTVEEILENLKSLGSTIAELFEAVTLALPDDFDAAAHHALETAFI